jgi:hypothetical protein
MMLVVLVLRLLQTLLLLAHQIHPMLVQFSKAQVVGH